MGSKLWMLKNGLGDLILKQSKKANRLVDLFCGSGSVSNFVARETELPVLAIDLQQYSIILVNSIISRDEPISDQELITRWIDPVIKERKKSLYWVEAEKLAHKIDRRKIKKYVADSRKLCTTKLRTGPIWSAYGGHYFSPSQALTFDYLLKHLPRKNPDRIVCRAAMIVAASRCAASPGHTAQPFQPTRSAARFLLDAWSRDPIEAAKKALTEICPQFANKVGKSHTGDAVSIAATLNKGDLVFVDPPYSGVQYSRFYHVLETLAKGTCGKVEGVGRYPAQKERPKSDFSNAGESKKALKKLLENLAKSKATVIFTFPEGKCSNGLSGDIVLEEAKKLFSIDKKIVKGKFSTLGGNNKERKRASRQDSSELVLLMEPK